MPVILNSSVNMEGLKKSLSRREAQGTDDDDDDDNSSSSSDNLEGEDDNFGKIKTPPTPRQSSLTNTGGKNSKKKAAITKGK